MLEDTVSRIRRNHGLEHATIHVLSEKYSRFSAQGNSDHRGFSLNIYGNISDQQVMEAVEEARQRLRSGETHLAVHPNCGTVLVTTAAMATLAVQLVFGVEGRRTENSPKRLTNLLNTGPLAVLMATLAIGVMVPSALICTGIFLRTTVVTSTGTTRPPLRGPPRPFAAGCGCADVAGPRASAIRSPMERIP